MIGAADRSRLLAVARESIEAMLRGRPFEPAVPEAGPLAEERGAFVTLTAGGRLRGCIGRVVADMPLVRVVAEMAVAAARDDYRFDKIDEKELPRIRIEISAMSPLRILADPSREVEVGRHGLIVRRGSSSGLLLPQVASGEGWDTERFLRETCRKAGLPPEAWKEEDATVQAFEAEVWGEEGAR
ncbi:MAG: AmmeMemoRadiSam system protein A [Candidatus Eisenbacteria bacterium]